jgi:hypothetical protein
MKVCQAWVRAAVICRALRAAIDSEGRRGVWFPSLLHCEGNRMRGTRT